MWCIGEYGDLLVNNVEMLDIEDPITVSEWILEILFMMFLLLRRFHEYDSHLITSNNLTSWYPYCSRFRLRWGRLQGSNNIILSETMSNDTPFKSIFFLVVWSVIFLVPLYLQLHNYREGNVCVQTGKPISNFGTTYRLHLVGPNPTKYRGRLLSQ